MSLLSFSCNVAAVIVVQVIVFLLARRGNAPREDEGKLVVKRTSRTMGYLGCMSFLACPIGLEVIGFSTRGAVYESYVLEALSLLLAPCFASACYGIWEMHRSVLVVSGEGIENRYSWPGFRFMRWADVNRLSFRFGMLVIRGKDGRTIKIAASRARECPFLDLCERHLPHEAMSSARDSL